MIDPVVLRQVPGCEEGRPPLVERVLPGGRGSNDIRYLETARGRFVLRTRLPPLERPGADSGKELASHLAAARSGLAPQVLAAAPDGRWLLMEFLEGRVWRVSDLESPSTVERLGGQLARLHAVMLPAGMAPMHVLELGHDQFGVIAARRPERTAEASRLIELLRREDDALAEHPAAAVLNHGDLQLPNWVGESPRFVDWEYAQCADPTYDVACLLTYYPQLQGQVDRLLGAAGLAGGSHRRRLDGQRRIFAALDRLWALAQLPDAG